MDEFELIERLLERTGAGVRGVRLGPGDDACVLRPRPGSDVVVTTDVQVEGTHFRWEWLRPADVGHRAVAACLSDLAAMGARPWVVLSSLAIPAALSPARIHGVQRGMDRALRRYGAALVGGNISSTSGPYSITLTGLGSVPAGSHLARRGATAGDGIWVSGEPGRAALGREHLARGIRTPAYERAFCRPEPRLALGWALRRRRLASAMIDVSDGLAGDLAHLLAARLGARLEAPALVPPAHFTQRCRSLGLDAEGLVLNGGEDYELLFTAPPRVSERSLGPLARRLGVRIRRIGTIEATPAIWMADVDGSLRRVSPRGWRHGVATGGPGRASE
ncbi:MAG: thiamine-phosphate kinase [Planctomycetes bacterium]|nr:thiamine-phosphate kinase [Planctomycetota bacterium]